MLTALRLLFQFGLWKIVTPAMSAPYSPPPL
jgi:hypothetical protein